jgi:GNAT superfamily N-acetyltransferase
MTHDGENMLSDFDGLIRVTRANIKPAAATVIEAFFSYPEAVYLMPDEAKRRKQQPRIYLQYLKELIGYCEIIATSPKMEGVAAWQKIDKNHPVHGRGFSFRWWLLSLLMDKDTNNRQGAYFEGLNSIRNRVMPERCWYLPVLGVAPVYQGKGYSSRLLKPMLARADREGLPVYLETQLEKNVTLYQRFGFRVVEQELIPGSTVYCWAMVKAPGK